MRVSSKGRRMVKPQKVATEDTSINNSTRETKCRKQCLKKANVQVTLCSRPRQGYATSCHDISPTQQVASIVLLKDVALAANRNFYQLRFLFGLLRNH